MEYVNSAMREAFDIHRFQRRQELSSHLHAAEKWIANRSLILSGADRSIDSMRWMTIVGSHRRANIENDPEWRSAVESCLRRCKAEGLAVLASRSTPTGSYLLHIAKRFDLQTVELKLPRERMTVESWFAETKMSVQLPSMDNCLWVSPDLDSKENASAIDYPLADAVLIAFADFVHAIDVRKGGKVDRLLRHRLDQSDYAVGSTTVDLSISVSSNSTKSFLTTDVVLPSTNSINPSAQELMDLGAVGWYRPSKYDPTDMMVAVDSDHDDRDSQEAIRKLRSEAAISAYSPIFSIAIVKNRSTAEHHFEENSDAAWTYLTHCTRSPRGPWPDQSITGYYDETLTESGHHSSLDTLLRILKQQRLLATRHLKHSDKQTVCLSQVPLRELLQRRTFQRHLHRWDWEPYGICIQRDWLERHGGRPVIYVSDQDWDSFPLKDLPFMQSTGSKTSMGDDRWSKEREWRILDDIRLAEIPATEAFVFVPTKEEALRVSSISRFPVMIVPSCTEPIRQS